MKLLSTFLVISYLTIKMCRAAVKKCCPDGDFVVFNQNSLSENSYNCARSHTAQKFAIETTANNLQMIAFNIETSERTQWPPCQDKKLSSEILINIMKVDESKVCVDILNNYYHVIKCDDNPSHMNDLMDISKLRKCCVKNFSFDLLSHQCVVNEKTTLDEDFYELLKDKSVLFEPGLPECQENEVLVEYHSNVHNLKFYDNLLQITSNFSGGPEVFPQNSFCIENSFNSSNTSTKHRDDDSNQLKISSKYIAKVCRNKSICKQMPCLAKCCKEGERMVFDEKTYCENHDRHLDVKFHRTDIKEFKNIPDRLEPMGIFSTVNYVECLFIMKSFLLEFGIMKAKKCDKFRLDEQTQVHYFNGIDGSLFHRDNPKVYPNVEFCVDYFQFKEEANLSDDNIKVTHAAIFRFLKILILCLTQD